MLRKILPMMLFLIMLSFSVSSTSSAVGDIEITDISLTSFTGTIGEDFIVMFNVTNYNPTVAYNVSIILQNFPPDYTLILVPPNFVQVLPGTKSPVAFSVDTDIGDTTGVSTGRVTAQVNSSHMDFFNVNMNMRPSGSQLLIESVEFEGILIDDGKTYDKARPGDNIDLNIRIKNTFGTREASTEIEEIRLGLTIVDFKDRGTKDLEMDVPRFSLEAGEIDSKEFKFEIPFDAENNAEYDVIIDAEGRDGNGITHKFTYRATLEIDKENDDVRFTRLIITPTVIKCNRDVTLDVEVTNFGSSDQDEAAYSIRSEELGINVREEFELQDDPESEDFDFNSIKKVTVSDSVNPGKYYIFAKTFYDNAQESDVERIEFEVQKCDETGGSPATNNNVVDSPDNGADRDDSADSDVKETQTTEDNKDIAPSVSPIGNTQSADLPGIASGKGFLISMILLVVVIAILGILLIYYFMFVKNE